MPILAVVDGDNGDGAVFADGLRTEGSRFGLEVHVAAPERAPDALAEVLGGSDDGALGVVAYGDAGDAALRAAASDGRVAALSLVDTPLTADAIALVGEWPQVPVLAVAEPADRGALTAVVDAYLASTHRGSRVVVGPTDAAPATVAEWMSNRLSRQPRVEEVVLETAEGWRLYGTRWLPNVDHAVPGVILLHTGRSDRAAFARLERLLADRGFAVLNFDWRGRGQSTNLGTYFDLPPDVRAAAWQDALAALEHLAHRPEVDADRLAAVGVVHGAEYAVRAAVRDERVKALVLLTGYRPGDESESDHLTSGKVDVLYVTSSDHSVTTDAMRSLYEAAPGRHTRYVEYPGGAIGYQLFEVDEELEPEIVDWLGEVLPP